MNNYDQLRTDYFKQLSIQKAWSKSINGRIEKVEKYIIYAPILLFVFGFFSMDFSFNLFNKISFLFMIIGFIIFKSYNKNAIYSSGKLFEYIRNKDLKKLEEDQFLPLWKLVKTLYEKMNIDKRKSFRIFLSKSNTYFPSIEEHHNSIYLITPMNFLSLVINNEGEAKAILAHEFGHVLQGDTNLWLQISNYTSGTHKIVFSFLVSLIIFLIITVYLNPPLITWGIIIQFILLFSTAFDCLRLKKDCLWCRKNSEKLADTAAIIYADPKDLISTLKKYSLKNSISLIHPPLDVRINEIESKLF